MANLKTPTPAKKKLLKPFEDPPTASSSDEEVETSSGEEEEQISDSKLPSTQTLRSPSAVSAAAKEDSGSDSGSETDSGSESEPDQPEKAIPVTVTPAKSKKKEVNDSPAVKSVKKRGNEGASTEMHAKRAKKVSGDDEEKKPGEDNKKPPFQRLWSEEDEITLLQGMIDFKAETGTNPSDDMNGFYDKVKKFISFDASKSQFSDKIRGLKKNYFGGRKKSIESSHDKKCLGLVKYIWGSDGMGPESSLKSNKKVEEKDKEVKGSAVVVKSNMKGKKVEEDDEVVMGPESSLKSNEKVEKNKEVKGSAVVVKSNVKGKKVEEDDEVVILGGDKVSSSWFDKSFLVRSIVSLGADESSVKRKWSKVPVETKKRIEEKFKLAEAKEYESLLLKTDLLNEVTSVLSEAV